MTKSDLDLLDAKHKRDWELEHDTDDEWANDQPTGAAVGWPLIFGVIFAAVFIAAILQQAGVFKP